MHWCKYIMSFLQFQQGLGSKGCAEEQNSTAAELKQLRQF